MAKAIIVIPSDSSSCRSELIGSNLGLRKVWESLQLVARTDSTVLIQGETGTGKELVAKAIHGESSRKRGPYVKLNCAALPGALLESELFGHERGAFTGAWTQTAGRFQHAHTGTLFMDEIGDLPLELQPKLLRVLQEREFSRVGGFETLKMQARIIAATNQDLESAVAARQFREDLYFRLRVIPISLPPLRERREDIDELIDYFLDKAVKEMGASARSVTPEARAKLVSYDWPGNVRELENLIFRTALLAPATAIRPEDIDLGRSRTRPSASELNPSAPLSELISRRVAAIFDGEAEGFAGFATRAISKSNRNRAQQRRHGGHHDGPEADQAAFVDGFERRFAFLALGL